MTTRALDSAPNYEDRAPTIMLYSHDGIGLEHLKRTVCIAQ